MPWMTNGRDTRYVPDWEVEGLQQVGWRLWDRFRVQEPSENSNWFTRGLKAIGGTVAPAMPGDQPPLQEGLPEITGEAQAPGTAFNSASAWGRENLRDGYELQDLQKTGATEDGRVIYTATYKKPRRTLGGQETELTRTQQFIGHELGMIDTSDNRWPLGDQDTGSLFPGGIEGDDDGYFEDRIWDLNSAMELNLPGIIELARNMPGQGWESLSPEGIRQEVEAILTSERLGSKSRREKLAEMVIDEYESSINGMSEFPSLADYFRDEEGVEDEELEADTTSLLDLVMAALNAGRGGGAAAPAYRPPDRREVVENVQNYLSTVLSPDEFDTNEVNRLADIYMRDHKRSFQNPGLGLQPWFSVKEEVRKTQDYQKIHALRPDTIPEEQWVSRYRELIEQAGVPAGMQAGRARNFAQTGTGLNEALRGAYRQEETRTGNTQPLFLQKVQSAVSSLARRF